MQQTLKGVFRLVVPEIALIGTACVVFLLGCFYNRRWLWFLVSLLGVASAMILAGAVKTAMPPGDDRRPDHPGRGRRVRPLGGARLRRRVPVRDVGRK